MMTEMDERIKRIGYDHTVGQLYMNLIDHVFDGADISDAMAFEGMQSSPDADIEDRVWWDANKSIEQKRITTLMSSAMIASSILTLATVLQTIAQPISDIANEIREAGGDNAGVQAEISSGIESIASAVDDICRTLDELPIG